MKHSFPTHKEIDGWREEYDERVRLARELQDVANKQKSIGLAPPRIVKTDKQITEEERAKAKREADESYSMEGIKKRLMTWKENPTAAIQINKPGYQDRTLTGWPYIYIDPSKKLIETLKTLYWVYEYENRFEICNESDWHEKAKIHNS